MTYIPARRIRSCFPPPLFFKGVHAQCLAYTEVCRSICSSAFFTYMLITGQYFTWCCLSPGVEGVVGWKA